MSRANPTRAHLLDPIVRWAGLWGCQAGAADAEKNLGCAVRPVDSPEQVVRGADILITITSSKEPVFDGRLVERGQHLNVAGSNMLQKREVDDETIRRADRIVVDQIEEAKIESGDLAGPVERGITSWERMRELGEVVCGKLLGRERPEEVTLFKSNGLAIEDVAVACKVLERAKTQGVGTEILACLDEPHKAAEAEVPGGDQVAHGGHQVGEERRPGREAAHDPLGEGGVADGVLEAGAEAPLRQEFFLPGMGVGIEVGVGRAIPRESFEGEAGSQFRAPKAGVNSFSRERIEEPCRVPDEKGAGCSEPCGAVGEGTQTADGSHQP